MARHRKPVSSDMGWSTSDKIVVRGLDLTTQVLGHVNLGDMAFLEVMGRLPSPEESAVFNAVAVTLVEHGMTPSAMVARLTHLGAPESIQGAIAAGVLGIGSVFVGTTEGAALMLKQHIGQAQTEEELRRAAREVVAEHRREGRTIYGLGHPLHKPVDPRTARLFEIAADNGLYGRYATLMQLIGEEAQEQSGKVLPLNATGAIGALLCELDFPIEVARGLGVAARAIGLIGHVREEMERPVARELWLRADAEVVDEHLGVRDR